MDIALLIPSLGAGGAERVITHLANYWVEQGYSVVVYTLEAGPSFYALSSSVQHVPLGTNLPGGSIRKIGYLLRHVRNLRRHLRERSSQVLIAFLDVSILVAIFATRFSPVSVIVSERSNPYVRKTNPWLQSLNHWLYRWSDRLMLQTQRIADTFPRLQHKITIIPNPVLLPSVQIDDASYATHLGYKKIVCMGRLTALKQYDKVLRAFHRFAQNHPGWTLTILGEGEEREHLERLRAELGLNESVHLPGTTTQPSEVLRQASVFFLSSRFEGFPNALCEAMAIGLPSIATRCPYGPEEIIQHQQNGWLVPVDDFSVWTEALETVTADVSRYQRLGIAAKQVTHTYALERIMQQWEDVLYDVTSVSVNTTDV